MNPVRGSSARTPCELVVVAGSAGAFQPLSMLLGALPAPFPAPVAVVLHALGEAGGEMAAALGSSTPLPVQVVRDGERPEPGRVHLAPPDVHVLISPARTFSLSPSGPVHFVRPAADLLFRSAAAAYPRGSVLALVLSGTGQDGAAGAGAVRAAGGLVIVQADPRFSGMTDAVLAGGAADLVLPLGAIPEALQRLVGQGVQKRSGFSAHG